MCGSHQFILLLHALLTASLCNGYPPKDTASFPNGHSIRPPPLTVDSILQTLSMFDFNSTMMESVFALTPHHERQLLQKILEIVAAAFEPPPMKALEDILIPFASDNAQVHAKVLSLSMFLNLAPPSAAAAAGSQASNASPPVATGLAGGGKITLQTVQTCSSKTLQFLRQHLAWPVFTRGSTPDSTTCANPFQVCYRCSNKDITAFCDAT